MPRRRRYAERTFHLAESVVNSVPAELAKRRAELGLSVRQVSRETGVPRSTLQRIESGRSWPEYDSRHLALILRWLGGNQPT
jgi:predicted transcriptional regulator